jgi:CRP-like cAMP-binding protein
MRPLPERTGNVLLDALPSEDLDRILDGVGGPTALAVHEEVQPPNSPIERVLFPTTGVVSVVTFLNGGNDSVQTVEAITVGREGMTNAHAVLGSPTSGAEQSVVQIDAKAFVVPVMRVIEETDRRGRFAKILYGYIHAFWAQTAYGSACNAVHHVTPRCARWLLQTQDRVDGDTFFLTQEYLANMLGVERSTVSVAAGDLQRQGLIKYARGRVEILDRQGLETASCECYDKIKSEYTRLVPLNG